MIWKLRPINQLRTEVCPRCKHEFVAGKVIEMEMPYCGKCGKIVLDATQKYCCWCGYRLNQDRKE